MRRPSERCSVATPLRWRKQVQCRALGGEHQPGRRLDREQHLAGHDACPVGATLVRRQLAADPQTTSITAAATGRPATVPLRRRATKSARLQLTGEDCTVARGRHVDAAIEVLGDRGADEHGHAVGIEAGVEQPARRRWRPRSGAPSSSASFPARRGCPAGRHRAHRATATELMPSTAAGDPDDRRDTEVVEAHVEVDTSQDVARGSESIRPPVACAAARCARRRRGDLHGLDATVEQVGRFEGPARGLDRRRRRLRTTSRPTSLPQRNPSGRRSTPTWRGTSSTARPLPLVRVHQARRRRRRALRRRSAPGGFPRARSRPTRAVPATMPALGEASVARQTVRAVHAGAGTLPDRVQAGEELGTTGRRSGG